MADIYGFELVGKTAFLMHRDDVMAADQVSDWRKQNKGAVVNGDDRTPPWTWMTYLYTDGEKVTIPAEVMQAALRTAGKQVQMTGRKTMKSDSQSGLIMLAEHMDFHFGKKLDKTLSIADLPGPKATFDEHWQFAKDHGFELFMRRAKVGTAKHVRVRPKFANWRITGEIEVINDAITPQIMQQLFDALGRGGMCDWRPTSPSSPGIYGMSTATVKRN